MTMANRKSTTSETDSQTGIAQIDDAMGIEAERAERARWQEGSHARESET
jgi:hypothetical protein